MNKKGKKKRKETNKEIAREWKGMQERTKVGRPKPEDEGQRSRSLRAEPTPRAEVVNTFDLLSGCGGPSSLPSALRGRGSLDSPGVIISARPIGADRKQEKQLSMTVFGSVGKNTHPVARLRRLVKQRLSHLCPDILASGNLEISSVQEIKREWMRGEYKDHATTTTALQSQSHPSCCWWSSTASTTVCFRNYTFPLATDTNINDVCFACYVECKKKTESPSYVCIKVGVH